MRNTNIALFILLCFENELEVHLSLHDEEIFNLIGDF